MSILDKIFEHKYAEVEYQKKVCPLQEVQTLIQNAQPPLDFLAAIRRQPNAKPSLIAEIKRASPSRGLICKDFDPLLLGKLYQENGAKAISVLTDQQFFQGSLEYLTLLAQQPSRLPLLRKDFIFDPYQIYEARTAGADAVLLIASALDPYLLKDLHALTNELGMSALVEVHHQAELEVVLAEINPPLIGINNRDLRDFSIKIETSIHLRRFIPPQICVVAESGIFQKDDIEPLADAGIDAILVGEALVSAEDIAAKVRSLALW